MLKGNELVLKSGQVALSGYVCGTVYDSNTKKFTIMRKKFDNGSKMQIFGINVSSKDKDGKRTYGAPIKVKYFGDTKIEDGSEIGIIGFFGADNYKNKDGKEVKGTVVECRDSKEGVSPFFEPISWDDKSSSKKPEPIEIEEDPF